MSALYSGRLSRPMYWLLLGIAASIYLYVWMYFSINMTDARASGFVLVALCGPRLRDMDKSCWWLLGVGTLGLIAFAIIHPHVSPENAKAIAGAGFLVLVGAMRGDPQPNRWGNQPNLESQFRRSLHAEILRRVQPKDSN